MIWKNVPARSEVQPSPTDPSGQIDKFHLGRYAFELDDSEAPSERAANWADRRLSREYVWAADPGAYVDECAAQLVYNDACTPSGPGDDTTPTLLFCLTNRSSSIVALTDGSGRPAAQYAYTPYGEIVATEYIDTKPYGATSAEDAETKSAVLGSRIGHQGLMFYRLDRPWDAALDGTLAQSQTGSFVGIYHNRNRLYLPQWGRFDANDPNGLGLPVLGSAALAGSSLLVGNVSTDLRSHYGDGMSAHSAYAGGPLTTVDPLGTNSLGELMGSMGIQGFLGGMIFGGITGGIQGAMTPGVGFWRGAGYGAAIGAVSGGVAGLAAGGMTYAFGSSLTGIWGAVNAGGIYGASGLAGGAAGSTFGQYATSGTVNARLVAQEAMYASIFSMGVGGVGGYYFGSAPAGVRVPELADDVALRLASGGGQQVFLRSGATCFRANIENSIAKIDVIYYDRWTDVANLVPQLRNLAREFGVTSAEMLSGPVTDDRLLAQLANAARSKMTVFGANIFQYGDKHFFLRWDVIP